MEAPTADPLRVTDVRAEIERRAVIEALRRHPEWRLSDLDELMLRGSRRGKYLYTVTVAELRGPQPPLALYSRPPVDRQRLANAESVAGDEFDQLVLAVITEAGGRWVSSGYVKERAGGPRWKLQASLGRLVEAGRLERNGTTSATRYRAVGSGDP